MPWKVTTTKAADKQIKKLPKMVQEILTALMKELEIEGPVQGEWPNYGKLTGNEHHCHLKKGNPTYVAVWWVGKEGDVKIIEVRYAGTHEKAPY